MNKNQHIPPGFKQSSGGPIPTDWELKHFEDVTDIDKESLTNLTSGEYKFSYISLSDVDSKDFRIETTTQIFKTSPSRARRVVKKGDILMSTVRPNLQGFTIIKEEVTDLIASTGFAVITCKHCVNQYLYYYLFSNGIKRQFYQLLVGSNYPAINSSDVRKLKIPLPPLPEQTAIANLLSTWDKTIETTQKLIAQKELRKKWLMQMLLTGKKRVKGFCGKWRGISLKEVFSFIKSYSVPRDELTTDSNSENIFCIHYGDIHALYDSEFLNFARQKLIPKIYNYKYKISEKDLLQDGDLIIADASEDYNGVGEAVEVINIQDKKAVGGLHTIVLRDISDKTENGFRAYLFSSEFIRNSLRRKATGTSVYSVTKSILEKLNFNLPEKQEQTSIVQILSSSDKEIKLLRSKLGKLKEQKKGLMQVLLTGKKRIKYDL